MMDPLLIQLLVKYKEDMEHRYAGRKFSAFEGIPYAKPPTGDLRFRNPVPADKWDGILIADKNYMCAQFSTLPLMEGVRGTEDCLYLYVYVPREKINPNENLPVVVHIHGGAFMIGSPKFLARPDYLMDRDVVYVSLNYRLGVLGFLSTTDSASPSNYGLKDQSMALKWIKEHIHSFGGNANSITLTGQSAGGASVQFHYLSPWSRGLFHRGLSQSGSVLNPWAIMKKPLEYSKFAAKSVNCTNDNNEKMMECLRSKSMEDVVQSFKGLTVLNNSLPLTFAPSIEKGEDSFLPEHPYKLLKEGKIYDVPLIDSNVAEEGNFFIGLLIISSKFHLVAKEWSKYEPYLLQIHDCVSEDQKEEILKKIVDFYFKDKSFTLENADTLARIFSDRSFLTGAEMSLRMHVNSVKSPVYYYRFDYPVHQLFEVPLKPQATHGDDLKLYLKTFLTPSKLQKHDERMMKLFTQFIYDYAKTGVPKFRNVELKPVRPKVPEIDYLLIASPTNVTMKSMKELAPNQFWDSLPIQENNHLFP